MFVAMFIARSQAMVGDSAAMMIDSFTYLFNSYAEKIKNKSLQEKDDGTLLESEKELRRLRRTRQRLWLEILPPICSVTTLIVLTIYIIMDSVETLAETNDSEDGTSSAEDDPNIGIMFFFSALNLGLDVLNVTCFARAKHAFGFAVIDKDRHRYMLAYDGSLHNEFADSMRVRSEVDLSGLDNDEMNCSENYCSVSQGNTPPTPLQIDEEKEKRKPQEVNLNMCSAYTHVFADTLRSTAVLLAAGLSYTLQVGVPVVVDAVAAFAVSLIILFSLGPLLQGIFHAWGQLRHLSHVATRLSGSEGRPLN
ncbi:hypothetical protein ACHAWF_002000 [Thalassiosira exigua]